MLYLHELLPVRAQDGRRLRCARAGCYEPLPPGHDGDREVECRRCVAAACTLSGNASHDDECPATAESDEGGRQLQLYAKNAMGRIGPCTSFGVHVEKLDGY